MNLTAWSYWIIAWAGNAAIAVGWVLYVEHFITTGHNGLLLGTPGPRRPVDPAAINLSGVKNMGSVQVITTVIKFVVLAFMATVGLFYYLHRTNFTSWNVSGESTVTADRRRHGHCLVQLLGAWKPLPWPPPRYANPDRNIPRAHRAGHNRHGDRVPSRR